MVSNRFIPFILHAGRPAGTLRKSRIERRGMITVQRKLTVIVSADVVGYSGLMERDEAGTLERLKANRKSVFDPRVAAHGGRIVKLMGDGALVEFGSVVSAGARGHEVPAAAAADAR